MLTFAKIMLDTILNLKGLFLLPELCYHVVFPGGPLSVMDLAAYTWILFNVIHPNPVKTNRNRLHFFF